MKENSRRDILAKLGAGAAVVAISAIAKPAAALMPGRPLMGTGMHGGLVVRHGPGKLQGQWIRVKISRGPGGADVTDSTVVSSQPSDIGFHDEGRELVLGVHVQSGQVEIVGLNSIEFGTGGGRSGGARQSTFGGDALPMMPKQGGGGNGGNSGRCSGNTATNGK